MTVINVTAALTALGGATPVTSGRITVEYLRGTRGEPAARRDGAEVILPAPVVATIVNGVTTAPLDVPGTDGTCYARIWVEARAPHDGGFLELPAVAIPATGSVDIADLVAVDPSSYEPVTTVVTAWELAVGHVDGVRSAVEAAAVQVADDVVRSEEAAQDAAGFAAAAEFDAGTAGQSAFQSGQSAAAALGHRNAAKDSADAAALAAGSITKDVPGGVPSLDGNARVPDARLPERLSPEGLSGTIGAELATPGTPAQVSLRKQATPYVRPAIQRVFLPCQDMLGSVQAIGYDPAGQMMFFTGGGTTIYLSSDFGTNRGNDKVAPAGTVAGTARSMVRFKGQVYCAVVDSTSNKVQVYRAAPITNPNSAGGVFAWSGALLVTNADTWITQQLATDGTYIYFAEYGDPSGGPKVYRSATGNAGDWQQVYHAPTLRHFHGIYVDPYNAGHLYLTGGDNAGLRPILRSSDYGATWTAIVPDNFRQSVAVSFTKDYVWFSSDGPNGVLYLYDRATDTWRDGAANHPRLLAVPGGAAGAEFYRIGYNGIVDPETGVYYVVMGNSSGGGNRAGLFYLPYPGGRFELLEVFADQVDGPMFIAGSRLFFHRKFRERITLA